MKELRKFYYSKAYIKISTISAPDLFGFEETSYIDDIFTLKCNSHIGEYLNIDRSIYNIMRVNDSTVRIAEERVCLLKNRKMVKRLLNIRKIKINHF